MIQDILCPGLPHSHLVSIFKPKEDCARSGHFVVSPIRAGVGVEAGLVKQFSILFKLVLIGRQPVVGVEGVHGGGEGEQVEPSCIWRNSEVARLPVENLHGTVLAVLHEGPGKQLSGLVT